MARFEQWIIEEVDTGERVVITLPVVGWRVKKRRSARCLHANHMFFKKAKGNHDRWRKVATQGYY